MDAVCVGETMALLIPEGTDDTGAPRFRTDIGGTESNVAVHLSRAGRPVVWRSALGDDVFGEFLLSRIAGEGVRCSVRTDPRRPTAVYFKEPNPKGTRVRYYRRDSAASALGPEDAADVWGFRPRLVHTTGITAAISDTAQALVAELLREAPTGTLRTFDVNFRSALHGEHNAETILSLARQADVVFCGVDEAESLWGATSVDAVRELIPTPRVLVVKQGAEGATAISGGNSWFEPAPAVEVLEPVGAGDAFAAGFLDRLLADAPLPDCLAAGAHLAGTVLGVAGDIPPATSSRA
ncbi:sugar kinase [Spiractinospora alimapuensis]|nr:sugar kinase [Spiractinospora alimapuensis]